LTCRADPPQEQEPIVYQGLLLSRESGGIFTSPNGGTLHNSIQVLTLSASLNNVIQHLVQFLATGTRPDLAPLLQYPSAHLPILTFSMPVAAREFDLDTLQERLATFVCHPPVGQRCGRLTKIGQPWDGHSSAPTSRTSCVLLRPRGAAFACSTSTGCSRGRTRQAG
jgi:hypothetical protein